MTEPISPIDASSELRNQIVDVVRSALRPDTRPLEAAPSAGNAGADGVTSGVGRKAEEERAQTTERKSEAASEAARNLALRFRVDPDTHNVTVLLVDQTTKRIVRSVPPEDLESSTTAIWSSYWPERRSNPRIAGDGSHRRSVPTRGALTAPAWRTSPPCHPCRRFTVPVTAAPAVLQPSYIRRAPTSVKSERRPCKRHHPCNNAAITVC